MSTEAVRSHDQCLIMKVVPRTMWLILWVTLVFQSLAVHREIHEQLIVSTGSIIVGWVIGVIGGWAIKSKWVGVQK